MKLIASIRTFASALFHRARVEREIDEELRAHIENRAADLERSGLPHAEAERQAKVEFGGYEAAMEESREALGISFIESILGDIRFGLRMLRKSPGFTAIAIITLALGIGANTVIFSAVNGILIERLPYAHASQLVTINGHKTVPLRGVNVTFGFSDAAWQRLQDETPAIQRLAEYKYRGFTLTGLGAPERARGAAVAGDFFSVMGVQPMLGRPILPSDVVPGGNRVAVLSYALWKGVAGGSPSVIGRTIRLNEEPYKVIGIMPPGFQFPNRNDDLWVPFALTPKELSGSSTNVVVARLKGGITLEEANAQLKTVSPRVTATSPALYRGAVFAARSVKQELIGGETNPLLILLGAVGFVLLIACANVSALMLARSWSRQHEVAMREALGATRSRIVRQFLIESVLLSLAGGACGLLIAVWGVPLLRAIAPAGTPRIDQVTLDARVLWFTLGASLVAGILFGLAPALQVAAGSSPATIRERVATSGSAFGGKRSTRLQGALVIFEIALAVILVVGATLLARDLENLARFNWGFRTDHMLTMTVNFSPSVCDDATSAGRARCLLATREVLQRVRGASGVAIAAATSNVPPNWMSALNIRVQGHRGALGVFDGEFIPTWSVSPGFFRAMGIRLIQGRSFNSRDVRNSPGVAIVNETFAREFLAGKPLGKWIEEGIGRKNQRRITIVGEVRNIMGIGLQPGQDQWPLPQYYTPFAQSTSFPGAHLIVRTASDPMAIAPAVEHAIWSVDKDAPIENLRTMNQVMAGFRAQPRFQALLLGTFGALGLLLAVVGIYGVTSYSVSQRMHEVGIRMAMGAQPGDVLRMVLRDGAILAGAGIVIGIGGALALTRLLRGVFFGTSSPDPATFAGVAVALALVALLACWIPARRAARLDPMTVLRQE